MKEIIKAPRHWPLWGEFTGDRWIPRTKDQLRGKCFNLMTSSWIHVFQWTSNKPSPVPTSPYDVSIWCKSIRMWSDSHMYITTHNPKLSTTIAWREKEELQNIARWHSAKHICTVTTNIAAWLSALYGPLINSVGMRLSVNCQWLYGTWCKAITWPLVLRWIPEYCALNALYGNIGE